MKSTWAGSCQILTVMTLASAAAWADCKNPSTQSDMNECAGAEYRAADAELNKVYKQLMATGDEPFRKRLQAAQRAWLAFRDAHLAATYPPEEGTSRGYGSARPMCTPLLLKDLTVERTRQLKAYLERIEGDVCSP